MLRQSASAFAGVPAFRAGLASTLCWLDLHDEARPILEQAASDRFEHVGSTPATLTALAAVRRGRLPDIRRSSSRDPVRAPGAVRRTGRLDRRSRLRARAHVARPARRVPSESTSGPIEHLQFACDFHEANDMPLWAARGQLGWAEALAARGDAAAARDHAARALELSREHGYGVFEPPRRQRSSRRSQPPGPDQPAPRAPSTPSVRVICSGFLVPEEGLEPPTRGL